MDIRKILGSAGLLALAGLINIFFSFLVGVLTFIILTVISMIIYFVTNRGRKYDDGSLPISPALVAYGSILLLLLSVLINDPNFWQIITAISGVVLIGTGLIIDYSDYQDLPQWWKHTAQISYWIGGILIAVAFFWNIGTSIQLNTTVKSWMDSARSTETATKAVRREQPKRPAGALVFPDHTEQLWCFQYKQRGSDASNLYVTRIEKLTPQQLSFRYTSKTDKEIAIRTERQLVPGKVLFTGQVVGTDSEVQLRMRNSFYFTGSSTVDGTTYDLTLYATENICK